MCCSGTLKVLLAVVGLLIVCTMSESGSVPRQRTRTEKGKLYQQGVEKVECERLKKRLTRQESLLRILMTSPGNRKKVNHESVEYDKTFADSVAAYGCFGELMESDEERISARQSLDELDSMVFEFKKEIYEWLSALEDAPGSRAMSEKSLIHSIRPSVRSNRTGSVEQESRHTVISNHSRKSYLEQKVETAGLRAEASVLKKTREAELKAEMLRYDQRIKKAEAMERVLAEGYEEGREGNTVQTQKLDESLLGVLKLQNAPKVNVDVFSGDMLEYQYFVATFREVVERVVPDERGRLTRLIQFTSGEAKELVRHCIHDDSNTCYSHAMSLLEKHYGDPHRIACAYLKELRQ